MLNTKSVLSRRIGDTPHMVARRRRKLTPFDRAASEFAAIEQRRLKLEEMRERNEARRIEVEQERNVILGRLADIAEAVCQQFLPKREQPT